MTMLMQYVNKKIRIVSLTIGLLFAIIPCISLYAEVKENLLTDVIKKPKIKKVSQSMGNVSVKGDEGRTALMTAVEDGNKEAIGLLFSKGADVNVKSDIGATALSKSELRNHNDIAQLLRQAGAINEPLSTVKNSMSPGGIKSPKHSKAIN